MSRYQSSDVRDVASFSPSGDYPVTDGLTACASTTKEFAGSFKLLTTSHLTGRAFLLNFLQCNKSASAILRYREYQQVTAAIVPASSTDKCFSRSPSVVENGDGMPATQGLWFVCCAYPRR